ncbi:hypothetical protein CXB51_034445 [Gossypium anomalum]|uniref:non-specific serine/threonine protein kinase n=1 Tax=Gossypium anomalum TaxID=47600 RepID=A0A8J5XWC3_9ROSI|nr:hypothetical protein CXB51_034445 [Gossypium anomalum]
MATKGDSIRPSPIQISKTSNLVPVTPKTVPKEKVDLGLSLSHPKEVPGHVGSEVCQDGGLPEGSGEEEKKASEHGISSASAKSSDGATGLVKTSGSAKAGDRPDHTESGKSSMCRGSTSSDVSNESSYSSLSSRINRPNKTNDIRWEAIQAVQGKDGILGLNHFRLLKRLGCGDIGSVYLSELSGTRCYFAMKVMDKASLASLMEFCPGGDLHTLRQRQPGKHFTEQAVLCSGSSSCLEYLHMLGIVYRDLKPENVLVREDGHIMLSDFDLSLRCALALSPHAFSHHVWAPTTCFSPRFFSSKSKKDRKPKNEMGKQVSPLPELIAEPTNARSMSFVGTHEYLAPEIIKGEGHGSAVDWWTFGIFLYELLFGKTPFKGSGNRATLFNVVGQPLRFPESPVVSFSARDLIRGLLVKEPQQRLAYKRGATEIKQHPFFEGVNWALIRCASPPEVPKPVEVERIPATSSAGNKPAVPATRDQNNYLEFDFF